MGADIYIKSITDAAKKQWRSCFDDAVSRRDAFDCPENVRGAYFCLRWTGDSSKVDALTTDEQAVLDQYKALQDTVEEIYQKMFPADGYFRDSYNSSNLLWTLGLSWWADIGEILNAGYLPLSEVQWLRDEVEAREITLPDSSLNGKEEEAMNFFDEKRQRFLRFLDKALEIQEPIFCSI